MTERLIKTDANGVVQDDLIHDSELVGLNLVRGGETEKLKIELRGVREEHIEIHLEEITYLKCDAFSSQNVIFEAVYITGQALSKDANEEMHNISPTSRSDFLISGIESGALKYFELVPSVGAHLLAVCKKVRICTISK